MMKNNRIFNLEYAIKNRQLVNANIELTYRCNWRCKHCYIDNYSNIGLDYNRICKLLDELKLCGVETILFTGGEVFVRKDFLKIIKYARDKGFLISIFSNISLLDDYTILKLKEYKVKDISCTLFSLNSTIHDKITGVEGSWYKTFLNIFKLKKENFNIEVKTILIKDNYKCYNELFDFLKINNIDVRATSLLSVKTDGSSLNKKEELNFEENIKVLKKLDEISHIEIKKYYDVEDYICHEIRYSISIDPNGNIYPCLNFRMKIGNIEEGIMNVFNSDKYKKIQNLKNKDLLKCKKCNLNKYCIRCTGTAFLENNDILECAPSDRFFAVCRRRVYDKGLY